MADKSDKESEATSKPKLNYMIIGLVSFLGLFFVGMIVALVMIMKMQVTPPQEDVLVDVKTPKAEKTAGKAESAKETPVKEEKAEEKNSEKSAEKGGEKSKSSEKPQFYKLRPVMVVNIPSADKTRYLQVDVELMTRSSKGLENIETYSPIIRNDLIILFSTQRYEDMLTIEGKELLRKKALETVQKIMKQNTGDPTVDQVLFTNFVSQ